ncbi:sce7725 family protein [Bacillus alkalicola]|uniref:Sce7725 family protein n=2 Tax=Bacillales TaxID=1385 RepID=A0ABS6JY73_9BACI|nr:sce7725 family protein [Bacillus alkalicola]MBU9723438.1 sce7725 family protein [Bacillus alkalicola]
MYFPYLRGRQYELIAIRELAELGLISNLVKPVVEPIKPTTTLLKTINSFIENELELAVIHNPRVGNFSDEYRILSNEKLKENFQNAFKNPFIIVSHIINENSYHELDSLFKDGHTREELLLINNDGDNIDNYLKIFDNAKPRFNLIPDATSIRRRVRENKVLLADKFDKLVRNSDYLDKEDSYFSEDHLFYKDEGYIGFSDYSIVGSEYSESGFAPYAVAIHIVYKDNNNCFRVKHFVSDSNEDYRDPAGKFSEALDKLMQWQSDMKINTYAMSEFRKHYEKGTYPGLGPIKKLAIMHHIELVSNFLDEER